MGIFRTLFGSHIPALNSYSDVYDLASDYILKNKSNKDLVKVLKRALDITQPLTQDDIFKLNSIATLLAKNNNFSSAKILFNKILDYDIKHCSTLSIMHTIAIAENDQIQINFLCDKLLEANYRRYIEEVKIVILESDIPSLKDSIKTVADLYNNVGKFFMEKNNYEKAKKAYEIAFEIDPTFFEAHHNIGVTLYYLKRYNEAINSFEPILNY